MCSKTRKEQRRQWPSEAQEAFHRREELEDRKRAGPRNLILEEGAVAQDTREDALVA